MMKRVREWWKRKRAEFATRKYPKIREHILPRVETEYTENLIKVVKEHGEWIEETLNGLDNRSRGDAVDRFARIITGYVQSNPEFLERFRKAIPSDPKTLADILLRIKNRQDYREMSGQVILFSQLNNEARIAEAQKILDVLNDYEKGILWRKIHNHTMLRVPKAAPDAAIDDIASKKPELRKIAERILKDYRKDGK